MQTGTALRVLTVTVCDSHVQTGTALRVLTVTLCDSHVRTGTALHVLTVTACDSHYCELHMVLLVTDRHWQLAAVW